jgi:hypothetical protein
MRMQGVVAPHPSSTPSQLAHGRGPATGSVANGQTVQGASSDPVMANPSQGKKIDAPATAWHESQGRFARLSATGPGSDQRRVIVAAHYAAP